MTNKDHIERTKRMIEVMQAYVDGENIETCYGAVDNPGWMWDSTDKYRISKTPDSINWDHVAPEFKYMMRGLNDVDAFLFKKNPPSVGEGFVSASLFSSYKRGTVDWKDSLVMRPGCE